MDKKGIFFLGPFTFKLLLALGSILILILLFVSLTGIFSSKTEIEQGRAILDNLDGVIKDMEDGDTREINVIGFDFGWHLVGWDSGSKDKPAGCDEGCICVCNMEEANLCQIDDCRIVNKKEVNVFTHFTNVFVLDDSLNYGEVKEERDSLCVNLIPLNIPLAISKDLDSLEISTELFQETGVSFKGGNPCFKLENFNRDS